MKERWSLNERTFTVPERPCPECHHLSVIGYLFVDEAEVHKHTHYVCTFWPTGKQPDGSYNSTKPCSWHGWSVPSDD